MKDIDLDKAVAEAVGYKQTHPFRWIDSKGNTVTDGTPWEPSTNWSQGGELIEKYEIAIIKSDGYWEAGSSNDFSDPSIGETPLRAAMKAIVRLKK